MNWHFHLEELQSSDWDNDMQKYYVSRFQFVEGNGIWFQVQSFCRYLKKQEVKVSTWQQFTDFALGALRLTSIFLFLTVYFICLVLNDAEIRYGTVSSRYICSSNSQDQHSLKEQYKPLNTTEQAVEM